MFINNFDLSFAMSGTSGAGSIHRIIMVSVYT